MSTYMFGVTNERLGNSESTRRDLIAREIGGDNCGFRYIESHEDEKPRGWFFKQNEGEPFDRIRAAEILDACGLDPVSCQRVSERVQMNSFKYPTRLHLTVIKLLDNIYDAACQEIANGRETTTDEAEVIELIEKYIGK